MATTFYTDNDLRLEFYNYVSNGFPTGVPVSQISANLLTWLTASFTGASVLTSSDFYFRFCKDGINAEPALDTELLTQASPINSANMRFAIYGIDNITFGDKRIIGSGHTSRNYALNSRDPGAATWINLDDGGGYGSANLDSTNNLFSFGVKSATSLVLTTIRTTQNYPASVLPAGFSESYTLITGWLNNSVYTNPLPLENQRYFGAYTLLVKHTNKTSPSYASFDGNLCGEKNLATKVQFTPKYYTIVPNDGEYVPGLFLTEMIITDNAWLKRGKIDNRVAALGRGNFEIGRIYQTTGAFGRQVTEEWLCVSGLTPSSYSASIWSPGQDITHDKFKFWNVGEYDYLLIRVRSDVD